MNRLHQICSLAGCLILLMGTAALGQDRAPSEKAADSMRKEINRLVNLKRAIYNMPPLHLNDTLSAMADEHSMRMAKQIVPLGHDGFDHRAARIRAQWKNAAGIGENVAAAETIEQVVELWWNSEVHKDNMIGSWSETGIGVKRMEEGGFWYCTQIFVNR